MQVSGPAGTALGSLTPAQTHFIQSLPKAELHAHLNGSIPISLLKELAAECLAFPDQSQPGSLPPATVQAGLETLSAGPALDEIHDFFHLFPAIYALTSTPDALRRATRAVLSIFLDGDANVPAQAAYLELRTTPRATAAMTRAVYLSTVLDALEQYPPSQAALIVSLDRRMSVELLGECVDLACALRRQGRRVVGLDLCGDPMAGDMELLGPVIERAKVAGLGVTVHIAEVSPGIHSVLLLPTRCFMSFNCFFTVSPHRPRPIPRRRLSSSSRMVLPGWGTLHFSTQMQSR